MGGRDHSTVIHAVKKMESRMEEDSSFIRILAELEKAIRAKAAR
jgi:chromosomal replication initiation ATPase DnaA